MKAAVKALLQRVADDPSTLDETVEAVIRLFTRPQAASPAVVPPRYRLPNERLSRSARLVIHNGDGAAHEYHVTAGYFDDGALGEIFARQDKEGGTTGALLDAVATAISLGLQHGIPWKVFEAKFARWRFPPHGMTEDEDVTLKMVSSPLDYMVRWISGRLTVGSWADGIGE